MFEDEQPFMAPVRQQVSMRGEKILDKVKENCEQEGRKPNKLELAATMAALALDLLESAEKQLGLDLADFIEDTFADVELVLT